MCWEVYRLVGQRRKRKKGDSMIVGEQVGDGDGDGVSEVYLPEEQATSTRLGVLPFKQMGMLRMEYCTTKSAGTLHGTDVPQPSCGAIGGPSSFEHTQASRTVLDVLGGVSSFQSVFFPVQCGPDVDGCPAPVQNTVMLCSAETKVTTLE